jgi:hypothetical protein
MYKFVRKDGILSVVKASDNSVIAQIPEAERVISFGGEIKALSDDGQIGGYAVIFSDAKTPDLFGDYFTKSTDFFFDGKKEFQIPFVLYQHGQNPTIKSRIIGKNAVATIDDVGVFVKAELNKRDKYEKAILDMVKKKKLGYSTGSVPHLVARKALDADSESGEITSWPIIELSLTPTPVEPRIIAATLKSYTDGFEGEDEFKALVVVPSSKLFHERLNQFILDSEESGLALNAVIKAVSEQSLSTTESIVQVLSGSLQPTLPQVKAFSRVLEIDQSLLIDIAKPQAPTSVKGIFEDALAEEEYKTWELWSTFSKVVSKIVAAAKAAPLAGASDFDYGKLLKEAVVEYSARLLSVVDKQVKTHLEGDCEYNFYLRALADPSVEDFVKAENMAIEDHCSLAVSAFKSIDSRVRKSHANRQYSGGEVKAGRVLSTKYQIAFKQLLDSITGDVAKAHEFLDSLKPKVDSDSTESIKAVHERTQQRVRRLKLELT